MIVQQVVAVLQLEDLFEARRVYAGPVTQSMHQSVDSNGHLPVARERLRNLRLGCVVFAQRQWTFPLGFGRLRRKIPLLLLQEHLPGLHLEHRLRESAT